MYACDFAKGVGGSQVGGRRAGRCACGGGKEEWCNKWRSSRLIGIRDEIYVILNALFVYCYYIAGHGLLLQKTDLSCRFSMTQSPDILV